MEVNAQDNREGLTKRKEIATILFLEVRTLDPSHFFSIQAVFFRIYRLLTVNSNELPCLKIRSHRSTRAQRKLRQSFRTGHPVSFVVASTCRKFMFDRLEWLDCIWINRVEI